MNFQYVSPGKNLNSGLYTRKKTWNVLYVTLCLLVCFSSNTFGQSPEVRKAFRHIDIEQPSKGMAALEQLVKANPENASYLYYLGLGQLRTGAKDKALASFEKGISLDEKSALNYAGKGHVKLLDKNAAEAKTNLDKALSISRSKDANVLRAVAEAYLNDTKYLLDAINLLNKARSINSTDPEIHVLLGDAYLLQNTQQGGEAVNSYERGAKADPKNGKPHHKVGRIFQRARNNDLAIENFNKAITSDPEYAPAYKDLGEIYYTAGQADKAVAAYEKYLAITETPGQAKFQYAFFLLLAKKYDKANEIFKEITTSQNVDPIALRYYAYSLTIQEKTEEARKIFEQYFQRAKPEQIVGSDYAYYGKILLKAGQDSLASENLAKAVAMDSTQIEAAQLNAESLFKAKRFDKAIDAYKTLIGLRKTPLITEIFNLGRAYFIEKDYTKADSIFTLVAEKAPQQTVGYLWAGKARRYIDSTGVQGLANPMYELVIEKGSSNPEKYKKDLIEAYEYLASYYVNIKPDLPKAKSYFQKILELDPSHAQAKEALKVINQPDTPSKGNKGGK